MRDYISQLPVDRLYNLLMDSKRHKSRVLHVHPSVNNGRENEKESRSQQELPIIDAQLNHVENITETTQFSLSPVDPVGTNDDIEPQSNEANLTDHTRIDLVNNHPVNTQNETHVHINESYEDTHCNVLTPQTLNGSVPINSSETYDDMQPNVSNSEIDNSISVDTLERPPPYIQLSQVDSSIYYSSTVATNRNQYLQMIPPQNIGQLTTAIPMCNSVVSNQGLYYVQSLQPHFQYGLPHYVPIQMQPAAIPLNSEAINISRQQQIIDERNQLNDCYTKDCFAHLSLSIILMIIFFIFGGPWSLFFTVTALIILLSSQKEVSTKRKWWRMCGYILQLIGGLISCFIALVIIFTIFV